MSEKEIYLIKTEHSDGATYEAYESYDEAKEHNRKGHWSKHALYSIPLHEAPPDEPTNTNTEP